MNNVFDFSIVTNWIHQMLTSLMPEVWQYSSNAW